MENLKSFINRDYLYNILDQAEEDSKVDYMLLLDKAKKFKELSLYEIAILLKAHDSLNKSLFEIAKKYNWTYFKNFRKFYGVSYISDFCIETCQYCGDNIYSKRNVYKKVNADNFEHSKIPMHFLNTQNFKKDIQSLLKKYSAIDEICILTGNNPILTVNKYIKYIEIFKQVYCGKLILNIPPLSLDEFKKIKEAYSENNNDRKIQFRVFQETYDKTIYLREHPHYDKNSNVSEFIKKLRERGVFKPPKRNFEYRLFSQDRALLAGFDEVGLGVLFGLNDSRHGSDFEILALIEHAKYLHAKYGKYPKTISFPRIVPSKGVEYNPKKHVSEKQLERYISLIKIALPEVELIITCRESAEFRRKVRPIINIEDFEARPGPGGNISENVDFQMEIVDKRKGNEILNEIINEGYLINKDSQVCQ